MPQGLKVIFTSFCPDLDRIFTAEFIPFVFLSKTLRKSHWSPESNYAWQFTDQSNFTTQSCRHVVSARALCHSSKCQDEEKDREILSHVSRPTFGNELMKSSIAEVYGYLKSGWGF